MSTSNLSLSVSDRLRWWLAFVSRVRSCIFGAFFKETGRGKCQPAAFAAKTKPKPQYSNTVLEVFVASRAARSIHLGFLRQQQRPTAFLCILQGKWRRQMSTSNLSLSVSDKLKWWLTFVSRVRSCIFGAFFNAIGRGNCQPAALATKTKPKPQYSNTVLEVFVAFRAARSIHLGFFAPAAAAD